MANSLIITDPILGFNYGNGNGGLGSHDNSTYENSFPSSPVLKGDIPGWPAYHDKVLRGRGDIVKGGQNFDITADGKVPSRTFSENNPPDFAGVPVGKGGKPGSPWTPNTSSPEGSAQNTSTNYTDLPKPPYSPTEIDAVNNYGVGQGGTFSPAAGSAIQETLSDYLLGSWS